jgi:squalene cyclase
MLLLSSAARAEAPAERVRGAIDKGLRRIEQGCASYVENRQCFSCHHQAMSILSMTAARRRGFAIEPDRLRRQVEFTLDTFRPRQEQLAKGRGIPGGNTMAVYALLALEAADHAADPTTEALVEYLLVRQRPDGAWPALANRPPTEGSTFTNNALAVRALKAYGAAGNPRRTGDAAARVEKAFAKGRDWLQRNTPTTTEDKVSRLRGLIAAGVGRAEIEAARDALLNEQRTNGSWAQLPGLAGDAYATGNVLMALRDAGLPSDQPAYRRGVSYLLASQRPDGAWLVETRSRPVQTFFDNGDPGGKSQFISFAATNWAVLALLEVAPDRRP